MDTCSDCGYRYTGDWTMTTTSDTAHLMRCRRRPDRTRDSVPAWVQRASRRALPVKVYA